MVMAISGMDGMSGIAMSGHRGGEMKKIERGSDHENRQCGADDDTIATDQGLEGRLAHRACRRPQAAFDQSYW
jgi:hypothetical protein